ncbi:MAG: hypothetical protein RR744_11230, partial [Cellulosilyticaceae bacterium]
MSTQKVVIGQNNILPIIKIDFSSVSAQFDPTLETFIDIYSPDSSVKCDTNTFCEKANYYSEDGKTWKEVDIEGVKQNGNFAISLEFESPITYSTTQRNILGYNIYQNGIKINDNPFMGTSYRIIDERAPVTIYQDDKFLQLAFASPTIPAILEDVAPGTHKYIIERRFNDKIGRSDEKTITVVDAYMAPKNFSATLSNDTPLLKWMPTTSAIQHHDGTEITTTFKYPETKSIKEYYIATGWSSKKMSTVANKQLKIITMKIEAGVENMHLYVYKNKQLCAEQPVDAFDYRSLVIELNNPVTVAEGD